MPLFLKGISSETLIRIGFAHSCSTCVLRNIAYVRGLNVEPRLTPDFLSSPAEMSLRGRSDLAYKLYNQLDPEGFVLNPAVFRLLITACAK
eukprot:9489183-Pyramimonas_sp.AAC.1